MFQDGDDRYVMMDPKPSSLPENDARFRDKAATFGALVALLIVAGLSASIVGYKVKQADWERTAALRSAYESMGGSPQVLSDPRQSASSNALAPERAAFITAFELNERVRAFDLYRTLQNTPSERLSGLPEALEQVGATEAAGIVRNAVGALVSAQSQAPAADSRDGAEAEESGRRISKTYGRSVVRSTQASLYRHLREVIGKMPAPLPAS